MALPVYCVKKTFLALYVLEHLLSVHMECYVSFVSAPCSPDFFFY
jgi:hypothetical protein